MENCNKGFPLPYWFKEAQGKIYLKHDNKIFLALSENDLTEFA